MGTPDLEGTFGTFTYYTDDPRETSARGFRRTHRAGDARSIIGWCCPSKVRRIHCAATAGPHVWMMSRISIRKRRAHSGSAGNSSYCKQGEWSPWIRVRFSADSRILPAWRHVSPLCAATYSPGSAFTGRLSMPIRRTPRCRSPLRRALAANSPAHRPFLHAGHRGGHFGAAPGGALRFPNTWRKAASSPREHDACCAIA